MGEVFLLRQKQLNMIKRHFPIARGKPSVDSLRRTAESLRRSGKAWNGKTRQQRMLPRKGDTTDLCAGAQPGL